MDFKLNKEQEEIVKAAQEFAKGEFDLAGLAKLAESRENLPRISGKQELIENLINQYLLTT